MMPVEAMNEVLRAVERETGKPVVVEPDPDLKLHATLLIARGDTPVHIVRYRAGFEPERPYLVVYQCGFLLRAARTPPAARFDLASTPDGRAEAGRLVADHFRRQNRTLSEQILSGLRDQLYDGLLLQLRSLPVGLRVDAWVAASYPALRDLQRAAVVRQLNENAQALRPEVRAIAPDRVLAASLGMNAAFAAFFARLWADPLLVESYRTAGVLPAGEDLLRRFDAVPDDPAHDRELIDAWGQALGLGGWYTLPTPAA